MNTFFFSKVACILALIAFFQSEKAYADDLLKTINTTTSKQPQFDSEIELNKDKIHIAVNGSLNFDSKTGILNSKIAFDVKNEGKTVFFHSLKAEYIAFLTEFNDNLKVLNYVGTASVKNSGWTITSKNFDQKTTGNSQGHEFWAIISNGDFKKMNLLDNYELYRAKNNSFVLNLEGAQILFIKIGYISIAKK